jgi:hypothetical protein
MRKSLSQGRGITYSSQIEMVAAFGNITLDRIPRVADIEHEV